MPTVFLGGTCAGDTWRDELISLLKIDYFNPVVDNWTEDAQRREREQRILSDYILYVIRTTASAYSIAEAVEDAVKRPKKTIVCILPFSTREHDQNVREHEEKALDAIEQLIHRNGAKICKNLTEIAEYLNQCADEKKPN